MTRTFTEDADAIVVQAYEHAVRLGHPYLGGEHLLLALAAADQPPARSWASTASPPGASRRRSFACLAAACSVTWTGARWRRSESISMP